MTEKENELPFFSFWENFDDGFDCDEDTVAIKAVGHILDNSIDDIHREHFYHPEHLKC